MHTKETRDKIRLEKANQLLNQVTIETIIQESISNILRWNTIGTTSLLYDEWLDIMNSYDFDRIKEAMTGSSSRNQELRSAAPYFPLFKNLIN
jgi:hypothetical protein